MTDSRKKLTIPLREATIRYGLSRPTLTKIGKENHAIARIGNMYLLNVDVMDELLMGRMRGEV